MYNENKLITILCLIIPETNRTRTCPSTTKRVFDPHTITRGHFQDFLLEVKIINTLSSANGTIGKNSHYLPRSLATYSRRFVIGSG